MRSASGTGFLPSPESSTAVLGCCTMICMLEESCRLPSVEGCGACIGTPPNVSSLGVVTMGNGLAIGLVMLAGVAVDTGLLLGTSFLPLAAAPLLRGSFSGGTIPARDDLEGKG